MATVTVGTNLGPSVLPTIPKQPLTIVERRWELFTWLLGIFAMGSVLGTLVTFKEKLLYSWKSEVQISAVVAIFSQLAQSALVVSVDACLGPAKWSFLQDKQRSFEVERFDEAMRGPEGSLEFLALILVQPRIRGFKRADL